MGELEEKQGQEGSAAAGGGGGGGGGTNTGVADYFAILGVGDDLLWKHTQKQREQQQLMQQQQEQGGAVTDAESPTFECQQNQEDQAALMERYYREIVEVAILTHSSYSSPASLNSNVPTNNARSTNVTPSTSSAAQSSSLLMTSSYDNSSDVNNQSHQGMILPSPSSHSDATTVATTILSASDATILDHHHRHHNNNNRQQTPASFPLPPAEINGFTIVTSTNPPQSNTASSNNNNNNNSNPLPSPGLANPLSSSSFSQQGFEPATHQHQHQQQQHATCGASTSYPWDTPSAMQQRYGYYNQQQQQKHHPSEQYRLDANLNPLGGLREQVCNAVLQWEEAQFSDTTANNKTNGQHFTGAASASSNAGSSSTGSLKGLRHKVKSSWQRWNNQSTSHDHKSATTTKAAATKFYLGYKRRTPDQENTPAIADLQLLYARLPRQAAAAAAATAATTAAAAAVTTLCPPQHKNLADYNRMLPVSPPGSSSHAVGLTKLATAAGHVLFRPYSEAESNTATDDDNTNTYDTTVENNRHNHDQQQMHNDHEIIDLTSVLPLPEGFDEWSIPEAFQVIYLPKPKQHETKEENILAASKPSPAKSTLDKLVEKTVLVASPSHGRRRLPLDSLSKRTSSSHPPSEVPSDGSTTEEAVEAYVSTSFSAPSSPREDETELTNSRHAAFNTPDRGSSTTAERPRDEGTETLFVPKLFTDIPWEEDLREARQHHHHPYYHPEEQWWYIPVLAVRRQRTGEEERFHEDPGIVDVTVSFCDRAGMALLPREEEESWDDMVEENEEEFSLLSKSSWLVPHNGDNSTLLKGESALGSIVGTGTNRSTNGNVPQTMKKTLGSPTILVKRNAPIGFADIAFATSVLDRFPFKNYKGLPLPEEELPMFCYPTGCRLHRAEFSDAPLPEYYGFVVKNERGDSIYVSCVSFFEPLTRAKIEQLADMSEKRRRTSLAHRRYYEKRVRRKAKKQNRLYCSDAAEPINGSERSSNNVEDFSDDDESDNCILTGFDTMTTFENKTICLVSRHPWWTGFRRFLSHLHILSGTSSDLPLERHISHLLLSVPVPKHGGPNVIVPLPALNQPMILSLPPIKDFPLVDLPYHRLFGCLDVPTIVTVVLGFISLERKVIVMSSRPSLVLDACELLRSLLFPFDLCAPYVPRLTEPFMSCLEFPGAIFVGIHDDGSPDGLAAVVRKNPPEDSILVDLDCGGISCSGNRYEVLTGAWDILPKSARSTLVSELETLCRDADIVPGQEPLDSLIDAAFDATLPSGLVEDFDAIPAHQKSKEPLDDRAIRDGFLRFFCSVLRGYERFLVVPDAEFLISGNEWFATSDFLASASKENIAFLNSFVSTQLFQSFIQRRTEDSDVQIAMFDECLMEYHSSPMPYGRLGGDVETVVSADNSQAHMLYSLLIDQSASTPFNGGILQGESTTRNTKNIADDCSKEGGESDIDFDSYQLGRPSLSAVTDYSEQGSDANHQSKIDNCDPLSLKYSESILTSAGDIITAPPRTHLPSGIQFIYCVDGNPCFPMRLNKNLFLPKEPDSWLVEMSKTAPVLSLARSEREVDEANRRRKSAISHRGFHAQKRCLWQLPKLLGSHFLGSWLLCIPTQVSQPDLSHDQQSRFLLRAFGALRLLRSKQRIIPDEAAYRALMVACGRTSSDRRVELVKLFGLLRSDGIFPSAVTLGQYTKALAEGYSKRSATELPEDSIEFSGAEMTESMSMRSGISRGGRNSSSTVNCLTASLVSMDGDLANLEITGRKWRQRGADRAKNVGLVDASSTAKPNEERAMDERHHRRRHRTWLPVVVSSSFLPSTTSALPGSTNAALVQNSIRLVALWSRTSACDSCGYCPLEEEIQAGWDAVGSDKDVLGSVSCPRCGQLIIPMLGYREMSVQEALELKEPSSLNINDADFASLPPQVGPYIDPGKNKASFVTYISPASLRLSLERYIDELGEGILERDRLKEIDPEVYYNFFWYCARFNLPLPLPIRGDASESPAQHYLAFGAWERTAAERGCYSGARAIFGLLSSPAAEHGLISDAPNIGQQHEGELGAIDPFDDFPLLARYNLQGFHPNVWDHPDLSEILVSLVTVCDSDRRDFRLVVECVLRCNQRRREQFGGANGDNGSDVNLPVDFQAATDGVLSPSVELDPYKTILYLAKYQCTTAFHTFFPAVAKPCKGYHFWCAIGTPLPIFDRLLREAVKRVNNKDNSFAPISDVSDVALGFRCVFGHLI